METFRILHIAPTIKAGGVAGVWINLTKEFTRLGHEVHLVGPLMESLKEYVASHHEVRVPGFIKDPFYAPVYTILNTTVINRILKYEKIDLILTHGPLALLCRNVNVKCFSVVHGTYANECKFMKYHPLSGLDRLRYTTSIRLTHIHDMNLYRLAAARGITLIAVSRNTKRELVERGINKDKVYAILNGIDKTRFKPIDRDRARDYLEKRYRIEIDGLVITHVGLGPRKGTHILFKALAMLRKMNIKFTALLCGKPGPTSYRIYLETLANGFRLLESGIRFLGYVPDEILPIVYNAADITIVPSYSEGGPLITPESLVCGTPVIATDVGGNGDYLKSVGLQDLLIPLHKYDFSKELLTKIIRVLDNVDRLHINVLDNINNVPSWNDVGMEYLRLFKRLLQS